jgi:hypothetical protein
MENELSGASCRRDALLRRRNTTKKPNSRQLLVELRGRDDDLRVACILFADRWELKCAKCRRRLVGVKYPLQFALLTKP